MANHKNQAMWGHCEHCNFFASPAIVPVGSEEAKCTHPVLAKYQLQVFGAGGCSGFEVRAGLPETVERPERATPRRAVGTVERLSSNAKERRQPSAR